MKIGTANAGERKDNAGVHVPPPLVFLVAIGLGFALQHYLPVHLAGGSVAVAALHATGGLCGIGAGLLAAWAFLCFGFARTSVLPDRPATSLIIRGPFRFTRNPLYLAMAVLYAAVALFLNALWPLLCLVPALVTIQVAVIAREERYLLRRFGAEYEAYMGSVRRWL